MTLRDIALAGVIAALYVLLSLVFLPISFGVYQVRVAEALTVLPFLTGAAVPGLLVGCLLANVLGGLGWQDILFGSLITLVAAALTRRLAGVVRSGYSLVLAYLPAALLWVGGIAVLNAGSLSLWSVICACLSLGLLLVAGCVERGSRSLAMAASVASLLALAAAAILTETGADIWSLFIGCAALAAAWFLTCWVIKLWRRGGNPNEVLAPLPPVLLNAFGVSAYLAPIIDVDYWFAVQMVGVGQLVACYLLGLPLLRLLRGRGVFSRNAASTE